MKRKEESQITLCPTQHIKKSDRLIAATLFCPVKTLLAGRIVKIILFVR